MDIILKYEQNNSIHSWKYNQVEGKKGEERKRVEMIWLQFQTEINFFFKKGTLLAMMSERIRWAKCKKMNASGYVFCSKKYFQNSEEGLSTYTSLKTSED